MEKAVQKLDGLCKREQEYFLRVENVYIDKVIVEQFELNNNFANLGIKDLRGTMNIGATYGPGVTPPENKRPADLRAATESPGSKTEPAQPGGPKATISYGK